LTTRSLAWKYRWRLLLLWPTNILVNLIIKAPYLFRKKPYETIYIPTRSGRTRALLHRPPPSSPAPLPDSSSLRPLHVSVHPGGFIGGIPESQVRLDQLIVSRTGAIVVSPTYRFAPLHPYPAAIDDIDDIIAWLHMHAADAFGADPKLMTTGGTSAGGNLALAACLGEGCSGGSEASTRIKGTYTCYAPIDLRIPPWQKKILCREKYPKRDPFSFLQQLYNCYADLSGGRSGEARCSPMVMGAKDLPRDVLMVLAEIDVVVDESRTFVQRVSRELEEEGETLVSDSRALVKGERRLEVMEVEGAFHGWLELPPSILEAERVRVFEKIVSFLGQVHRRYGCSGQST
jgi:acetyl esterase/lipase